MTTSVVESNGVLMTIILKFYWTLVNLFSSPTKERAHNIPSSPPTIIWSHTQTRTYVVIMQVDPRLVRNAATTCMFIGACSVCLQITPTHSPSSNLKQRRKIWVFVIHPKHTRITLLSWGTQPYRFCH
jgi:hypothetical protein